MTVEQKLKHFFNSSVEDARMQSETAIREYTEVLNKEFDEFKDRIDRQAALRLKAEETQLRRDLNHELLTNLQAVKKELADRHDELKIKLFGEVTRLLTDFRKTPEYKELLKKQITDALTFAGEDVITVYIDPDDASLKDELANELNCNVVVSDYSFGGGTRTVIEEKQILIDNSFETKFDNLYDDFSFSGGISND